MTEKTLSEEIKWNAEGLAPAVVQDAVSKEVLMLAYMNKESLQKSIETGYTWFWSRSRGELWNKGATSGNLQRIETMAYDCDADALLLRVRQQGPACHTGRYSCFYQGVELPGAEAREEAQRTEGERFEIIGELERIIAERYAERPEGAYTTYLFEKGVDKILKKVGEEAAEVIIAAKNGDNEELRNEAGDLLFHLMVLLRERGLPLDEIMAVLKGRFGQPTTNKMR
ncbi:bifunctional phosphoribosyl-AMP cyclohydrolase/phosphoribosyl-ATP diphosphatase HisIE [Paenibacillus sp. J5C_2022]|uniref:bifunctional phosphoribosyl-AMP cyclohydrolase/phosphoribosyl-ATP diphosphatase HisIE n=1 Tax=Paenibacillus sp. J5C2022 TaxID=2977129 RepID=UPI0021CF8AE6|nr:bifunctional phosphoribosyl-AMP cyclohydrolase/phosphoribosyl-ATP diphosphatase HisIE [Paenibacillus sp. J5C2022]MCU6712376.1 bifunctional phosphoribosyl-AMP cyclohydrolase/phosphoribosyl-ATP diphosphatase HisIE [Paenibacillus sp. J5C2022]